MALDDKTFPDDLKPEPAVQADITGRLKNGMLSCAAAFESARQTGASPARIGRTMDALRLRLTECQIGLFGYPGHTKGWAAAGVDILPVPAGLEDDLRASRAADGSISCLAIWQAAEKNGLSRMQAGWAADKLGLRIEHCRLGAF
ncbi:MAG: hypothetical protein PHI34_10720 [Acidobacteriota bacterium]|nr:hypothetical protein [Acidobacteriota bacterium]